MSMALVNRVDKRVKMDKSGIVRYQLLTHCFLNGIQISDSDLKCLTELGLTGERELTEFCMYVAERNIFKTPQSARNAITKAEKKRLLVKIGKNRKTIRLNDDIKVQTEGTVLLDYKFVSVESEEVQANS
jgi:hypothetical protein